MQECRIFTFRDVVKFRHGMVKFKLMEDDEDMAFVRAMYTPKQIGELVAKKRLQFGLSQAELAEQIGLEERILSRIEAGRKILTTEETEILSSFIETSFHDLTSVQADKELSILHRKSESNDCEVTQRSIHLAQVIFHEMLSQSIVRGNRSYGE
ncbi:helix-turn-helix domain-containing protein [Brevibacillus agri BAB-2500]|nr:helix-turn-helix domain-containing protein [Brevibacillus agri BAB-2500]